MKKLINNSWAPILENEFNKEYFKDLERFIDSEYQNHKVYPDESLIFNAFSLCPIDNIKVVIIGQDPYHNEGEAMGLAFSVNKGIKIPPSLKNIYKELNSDLGVEIPKTGDLTPLTKEGVFLINTILTVRENEPLSHKNKGWETFTDTIIKYISEKNKNIVFVLWGANAIMKESLIDKSKHLVIKSVHPSPLSASRGFFGSKPFSKINEYLKEHNIKEINFGVLNES